METLFGKTDIKPRWGVNIELQMAQPIHESLLAQISKSVFGYAYNPYSFMMLKKNGLTKITGIHKKLNACYKL